MHINMIKHSYCYDSPIGPIYIAESEAAITDLTMRPVSNSTEKETPLISLAIEMLSEYFEGKRKDFDGLPINLIGTEFQRKAWNALLTIPYGQTRSYKQQAEAVGNAKASRAVGAANGKNPISIIVPCHRVIGSDNALVGYAGGLDVKKTLLDLERFYCEKKFLM